MNSENSTAILYITNEGLGLAKQLQELYPGARVVKFDSEIISKLWRECGSLIFIMAAGIVVRTVSPLIGDKKTDPAIVVLDEKGMYAISLLSGHLGGANGIAGQIADFLGGTAVITTASDVNNLPSIDLWARENRLIIENRHMVAPITTSYLDERELRVYSETETNLPEEFLKVSDPRLADVLITNKEKIKNLSSSHTREAKEPLYLRPKNLVIGIGCNSGTSAEEIEGAVVTVLDRNNLSFLSVCSIATVDKKAGEPGLAAFAKKHGFEISLFTCEELNAVDGVIKSEAALKATGAKAVAEPAALLLAGADGLLVPKEKEGNVTVAIAVHQSSSGSGYPVANGSYRGKIYVVGIGPGSLEYITPRAKNAITNSDVIVGYDTYLALIQELAKDKEVISTGMTQETMRCETAVELAGSGKTVSVISGGDPGIYAMAGLVFEILRSNDMEAADFDVEVIPGITALSACAAKLGAPLMHDFVCISLSDRLTQWGLIEKRLEAAAMADFVIVLYNPKSKGRTEHISKARDIILEHREPETPVGIVKAAMRESESAVTTNLGDMLDHDIDMQTTVIVGNSQTFIWNSLMVTPRGYEIRGSRA